MTLPELPTIDLNSARVDGLVARAAPVAVLFRRGPSKRVRLLRWDLRRDVIEPGQWFKGRIYSRRCDLSPDGALLSAFAASFRAPYFSWTAISRPPWLTALALWPKGDCWGGGGLFRSGSSFDLNHRPASDPTAPDGDERALADGFRLPRGFRIGALGQRPGWGEDDPIQALRLARDGWTFDEQPSSRRETWGGKVWYRYAPPLIRRRRLAVGHKGRQAWLRLHLHAVHERQGRWLVETADIVCGQDRVLRDLGRVDWADAAPDGDVIYTVEGRVYRLARAALGTDAEARLVADLNPMTFEAIAAPDEARAW